MKILPKGPILSLLVGTLLFSNLIAAPLNASQDGWTKVAPEGESFSVLMPTAATEGTRFLEAINDWLPSRLYFAVANNKKFSVLVVRKTTREQSPLATDFQNFTQLIEASLRNVAFAFEMEDMQNGDRWRQYKLKINNVAGVARLIETEKVFYALVVTGADENDRSVSRFFESFAAGSRNTEESATGVVTTAASYSQSEQTVVLADNEVGPELWPRQPRRTSQIYGGVLNGKATSLPKPRYPSEARGISGTVEVKILIDENGRVIFAEATEGPAVLREVSVAAARAARFSPTRLKGQPVKVHGQLHYNFVSQ